MAERDAGRFSLAHLLAWAERGDGARAAAVSPGEVPFSSVTMSDQEDASPPFRPGALFVAIRGERRDGHDFVRRAIEKGARAALVARVPENLRQDAADGKVVVIRAALDAAAHAAQSAKPPFVPRQPVLVVVDDPQTALQRCGAWWRRQMSARVIGITGSVGKTTTKDLTANVLSRRFRTLRTEGNLNNELGLPFMLLKLTPQHERAVLEIGISDVGEMATFAALAAPDVAVVTRVAPAHMHRFKTIETVEREKGRLVEALRPDGIAVLNGDDPRVARMAQRSPGRVLVYGEGAGADVRGSDVDVEGAAGLALTLEYGGRRERVRVPLVGRHFVPSVLAAAACGFLEGCSWEEVVAGLGAELDSQRLKPRELPGDVTLLDDTYNASPEATKAALNVLALFPGHRIAVLGDMFELGEYAETGHADVGRYVPGHADTLITVGEWSTVIARAAREAGMPAAAVHAFATNEEATDCLRARLGAGDSVLIKGSRGMRMDSIVRALTGEPEAAGGRH